MNDTTPSLPPADDEAAQRLWRLWQKGQAPDLLAFLAQAGPLPREQLLEVLRVDQRERWQRGERILVESYLDQIASLRGDTDGLLDLVTGELVLREFRRERPQLDEYLARFPKAAEQIRRQFAVHRAMADTDDPDTSMDLDDLGDLGDLDDLGDTDNLTVQDGKAKNSPDSPATWLLNDATVPKSPSVPTASKVPQIPGYEIISEIDRGGMGVVYKARQTGLNRIVALKMILAGAYAGQEQKARFRIEAEAVARLQHPNIIQIYEVGEHDGQMFFSLEYAEGGSLAQRLLGRPQPHRKAAQTLSILARGIHAAHQCGIVHRDLKPANVLLTSDGVPKVTDFGLAKQLGTEAGQTRSGIIMGTPSYMAPEQAVGKSGEITPATDIYALGAILYEMLTGRPPFVGESSLDTLQQVLVADPIQPNRVQPTIPRDLETICLKCLAKEPVKRYPSGQALADDLQRFLDGEPIRARRVPLYERWWKWAKRRPAVAALTALLVVVGFLGLIGVLVQWREALRARAIAQALQAKAEVQLYALSVAHAESELTHGDADLARASLAEAPERLRNWEWHYLQRLCRSSRVTLRGHDQDVTGLAFGDGGRLLVTTGNDLTVRLWDAIAGREVRVLTGHEKHINAAAFHSDGKRLATCDDAGSIKIWRLDSDTEPTHLAAHRGFATCVIFLPKSERLGSAGQDGIVRIWDLTTHQCIHELAGHEDMVMGLACSPDGQLLASAGKDRTIRLWDAATGKLLHTLTGHNAKVTCVAFSPEGGRLASCGADQTIRLWNPAKGEQLGLLTAPTTFVSSIAFQPNSERLAAVCGEPGSGEVRIWDLAAGHLVPGMRSQSRQVTSLAFNPAGDRLATALADGSVHIVEPDLTLGSQVLQGHSGQVNALTYLSDRQRLASVGHDHKVVFWDASRGRLLQKVDCSENWLLALASSGDGRWLAAAGQDTNIYLLDAATGKCVHTLTGHTGALSGLALNHDGSRLASAGEDQVLRIWDTATQQAAVEIPHETGMITALAMTADGRWVATSSEDKSVQIWDARTGQRLRSMQAPTYPRCLAFSRDGRFLAAGCGTETRGEVCIWDTGGNALPFNLVGHNAYVLGLSFRPDGSRLATASGDRTVKVWDLVERKPLLTLIGPTNQVQCVQFSPDGHSIAAGSVDGTVRIWNGTPLVEP